MYTPEILIISNRHDFACDYVCASLYDMGKEYIRLNTDDLSNLHVYMDPIKGIIEIIINEELVHISENALRSILYRGPTYLRETSMLNLSPEEKLSRSQWAAFIRALMIFDKCTWVNHPGLTYIAETKAVQLKKAHQIGFRLPETIITNSDIWHDRVSVSQDNEIVVKGIDTIYLGLGEKQAFGYTNVVNKTELTSESLSLAPVFVQQYLEPKVDLRVTVIGKHVYSVEILSNQQGIKGDWRLEKDKVKYIPVELPKDIETKCIHLVSLLGLAYGAIDLVRVGSEYYFIEINPTGEWAWLVDHSSLPIDDAIARFLISGGVDSK